MRTTLVALCMLFVATVATGQQYPELVGHVNDFAGLLQKETRSVLERELLDFKERTTIEIAIVTVSSLNGRSIESYAQGLGNEWGVGAKGKNNGVILLVAPSERKMRIEVAPGAHQVLTDRRANEIRDRYILPAFKEGNVSRGIVDGTRGIMSIFERSEETASISESSRTDSKSVDIPWDIILVIYLGILALAFIGFIHLPRVKRAKLEKDEFLKKREQFPEKLNSLETAAAHADVKKATKRDVKGIRKKFENLSSVEADTKMIRDEWHDLYRDLANTEYAIQEDRKLARKARTEGPKLLKKMKERLKKAEEGIRKSKHPSARARQSLERARAKYNEAYRLSSSNLGFVNWVVIYLLLSSSESHCSDAVAWSSPNPTYGSGVSDPDQSRGRSGDSYSSPSSDFGGGGGFGGPDSGGSTGSW